MFSFFNKRIFIIFFLISFSSCSALFAFLVQFDCSNTYVDPQYENYRYTNYQFHPNKVTKSGIKIDSNIPVDLDLIDQLTTEVETCINTKISRCGIVIKIPDDYYFSKCSQQQRFPCNANPEDRSECNGCAGVNEYPNIIEVTPDLSALKHEYIHRVLHIYDHNNEIFKKCQ